MPCEPSPRIAPRARAGAGIVAALAVTLAALAGGHAIAQATVVATLERVGFAYPDSVLHHVAEDVYLVTNVAGPPTARGDSGFISRVAPSGEVLDLRWIDGARYGVELHAPKGMAIASGRLYVADIDRVRIFDARTGSPVTAVRIVGAQHLDAVVAANGGVYVTDSGWDATLRPVGRSAIYRIEPDLTVTTVLAAAAMPPLGGMALLPRGGLVATGSGPDGMVVTLDATGAVATRRALPMGGLDGVVALPNGDLVVASGEASSVVRLAGEDLTPLLDGLHTPAGLGLDAARNRLLVPFPAGHGMAIVQLP